MSSYRVKKPPRFKLAITGHRLNQLPEDSRPALQQQISDVLKGFAKAVKTAGRPHDRLVLVSALAEGADRMGAQAAQALDWPIIAPLPFLAGRYSEDFPEAESKAEFFAYLKAAARVIAIDGAKLQSSPEDPAPYFAVGEKIVSMADGLLAVWNGAPPKGPGGTAEVCAKALDRGLAVVWLAPDASEAPRLILPEPAPYKTSFRARLFAALRTEFKLINKPESMRVAETPAPA